MALRPVAFSLIALGLAFAGAQEPYLDDRSDPAALIRSLYNAINRGEYARAYSYFAEPPAADLEAYARGYQDTVQVDLLTGRASQEGAAGSVYYELPVAIRAFGGDGGEQVFAGCYSLRLANPAIQGEDFRPLHIVDGSLSPSELPLEQALPLGCGEDAAPSGEGAEPRDAEAAKVQAMFEATTADRCELGLGWVDAEELLPQRYELSYREDRSTTDEPGPLRQAALYRYLCWRAAYNEGHVYFLVSHDGQVAPLHFAVPLYDVRYVGDDFEAEVESLTVTGFGTTVELVNSDFDPETLSIWEFAKWRGIGDAFSAASWSFDQGRFQLQHYVVDATYDGEMDPTILLDYR